MSYAAAFDTSVIVFALARLPQDPQQARRWQDVHATLNEMAADQADAMVPSAVLAELCAAPSGASAAAELTKRLNRIRVMPFDAEAAELAGSIARSTFEAQRLSGGGVPERHILKFDIMILATAIRWNARKLVTANQRDFEKFLRHTPNKLELVRADEARGQLTILGSG